MENFKTEELEKYYDTILKRFPEMKMDDCIELKNKLKNISSLYITTYKKGCNLEDLDKCKKVNSAYIEVKITDKFH